VEAERDLRTVLQLGRRRGALHCTHRLEHRVGLLKGGERGAGGWRMTLCAHQTQASSERTSHRVCVLLESETIQACAPRFTKLVRIWWFSTRA